MVQNGAKLNTYSGYLYNTLFGQNTEAADFRKAGKRVGTFFHPSK
jgi:hypothetical protein